MEKNTLRYSGIVFLAGASYGAQATTVKITYAAGFTWTQVVASQALFAAFCSQSRCSCSERAASVWSRFPSNRR